MLGANFTAQGISSSHRQRKFIISYPSTGDAKLTSAEFLEIFLGGGRICSVSSTSTGNRGGGALKTTNYSS